MCQAGAVKAPAKRYFAYDISKLQFGFLFYNRLTINPLPKYGGWKYRSGNKN